MSGEAAVPRRRQRGHRGQGTVYRRAGRPGYFGTIDVPNEDGTRQRKHVWAEKKRAAQELLADIRDKVRKGLPVDEDPQTVGDFLATWLSDVVKPSKSPNTWSSYEGKVRLYLAPRKDGAADGPYLRAPQLGGLKLATLQPRHVQAAVAAWQAAKMPAASTMLAIGVLKTALSHAERQGLVARNVAKLVVVPQIVAGEIVPLDRAGVDAFLAEAAGHRLEWLFRVALSLGIREGEALGLRRQDVDLDVRQVRVRVQLQRNRATKRYQLVPLKTPKSRRDLTLPEFAVRAFRAQFARQAEDRLRAGEAWQDWEGAGLVFADELGGPLSARRVRGELAKLRAAAGLPGLRFHDTRHTCATFMLAQGVPEHVTMAILGHTNPSMTRRYQHVPAELRRQAADRLDEALGGPDRAEGGSS